MTSSNAPFGAARVAAIRVLALALGLLALFVIGLGFLGIEGVVEVKDHQESLLEGDFTNTLLGSRATYTVTPLMFVSALVQYSSAARAVSANVRLRWEYRPGSEFFVVWNEQRDTLGDRFPTLANRALIVKLNTLFRF